MTILLAIMKLTDRLYGYFLCRKATVLEVQIRGMECNALHCIEHAMSLAVQLIIIA